MRAGNHRSEPTETGVADGVPPVATTADGERPIDYDVLTRHLGYLVRRAQLWIFQDFIRTLATVDVRPAQYSVLVVIGANPGLPQIALAQALGIERARLVRLLDELQHRGLIERQSSASDRRSHALHLTKAGRRLLVKLKALAAEHEAHLAEKLGPERHGELVRHLASFAATSPS